MDTRWSRRWLPLTTVALLLAGLACAGAPRSSEYVPLRAPEVQFSYPAWFVHGGAVPGLTVGYAPAYSTAAAAESVAVIDAHARARLASRMRLVVEKGFEAVPGEQLESQGEDSQETPLADSFPVFVKGSVTLGGMHVVAVTPDSTGPGLPSGLVTLGAEPPGWIQVPPSTDGDWWYAVGVSTAYYREYYGWDEAERHGRQTLALNAGARLRSLMEQTEEEQRAVLQVSTAVELGSVSVVSRWRDANNCYVLVRGRVLAVRTR